MTAISLARKVLPLLALASAMPAFAQADRTLPTGSPLGAVPIIMPKGDAPAAASGATIDGPDMLARQQAEAVARFQAQQAYRARQAALAESVRPLPSPNAYVDLGRLGDEQRARQGMAADAPAQTARGPLPSLFGGGISTSFGGGIRTPWSQ